MSAFAAIYNGPIRGRAPISSSAPHRYIQFQSVTGLNQAQLISETGEIQLVIKEKDLVMS